MKRLTKRSKLTCCGYMFSEDIIKQNDISPIAVKLGKIEDLEEEMGIDVIEFLTHYKETGVIKW